MKRAARKIDEKFDRGTKCRGSIIIVKRIHISGMFICITPAITYSRMTFKTNRIQLNVPGIFTMLLDNQPLVGL